MRAMTAACILAFFLFAAASVGAPAPNVKGVFVGETQIGTCFSDDPCAKPARASALVFTRNARSTTVKLAPNGTFAAHLAAGAYTVSVLPTHARVTPSTVRVPRVGVIHPRLVQRTIPAPAPA